MSFLRGCRPMKINITLITKAKTFAPKKKYMTGTEAIR
jgi:hypothetical protein